MKKLDYDKQQIEAAIDRIAERTMRMDLAWDWPCDELISLGLPHGNCGSPS